MCVSFLNEAGTVEKWEYQGDSWEVDSFSKTGVERFDYIEEACKTAEMDYLGYQKRITNVEYGVKIEQNMVSEDENACLAELKCTVNPGDSIEWFFGSANIGTLSLFTEDNVYINYYGAIGDGKRTVINTYQGVKIIKATFAKSSIDKAYIKVNGEVVFSPVKGKVGGIKADLDYILQYGDAISSLVKPVAVKGKAIMAQRNPTIESSDRHSLSILIPVEEGDDVEFNAGVENGLYALGCFNAEKQLIDYFQTRPNPRKVSISNGNIRYVALTFHNTSEAYVLVNGCKVWEFAGKYTQETVPSKDDLQNTISVSRNKPYVTAGKLVYRGRTINNPDGATTDYIACTEGHTIKVSAGVSKDSIMSVNLYDENKTYIDYYEAIAGREIVIGEGVKYVRMGIYIPCLDLCYIYDVDDKKYLWKGFKPFAQFTEYGDNSPVEIADATVSGKTLRSIIDRYDDILGVDNRDYDIRITAGGINASGQVYSSSYSAHTAPVFVKENTTILVESVKNNGASHINEAILDDGVTKYRALAVNDNVTERKVYSYVAHKDMWIALSFEPKNGYFRIIPPSRISDLEETLQSREKDVISMYADLEGLRNNMVYLSDFNAFFFSDIHGSADNMERIVKLAEEWSKSVRIDGIINTGDTVKNRAGESVDWYHNYIRTCPVDVLTAVGNHDVALPSGGDDTPVNTYNRVIKPTADKIEGITQPENAEIEGKCYYYKDYNSKVRVIILDAFSPNSHYNSSENTWLKEVLDDAKGKNLVVICCNHTSAAAPVKTIPCSFQSEYSMEIWGLQPDVLVTVQSFIDSGGLFVGWLCGHTHFDNFVYKEEYPKQPMFTTMSARFDYGPGRFDLYRSQKPTNRDYDSFNMVSVDTKNSLLKILRIGEPSNFLLQAKHLLVYDYRSNKVVTNW